MGSSRFPHHYTFSCALKSRPAKCWNPGVKAQGCRVFPPGEENDTDTFTPSKRWEKSPYFRRRSSKGKLAQMPLGVHRDGLKSQVTHTQTHCLPFSPYGHIFYSNT